jgi:predicted Zn-dependent protease
MKEGYEGAAWLETVGDGPTTGSILVRGETVRFEGNGAEVEIPLAGLELRLGGASDRLVFLAHPSRPDCSLYTSDHSILQDPQLLSQEGIAEQVARVRSKKRLGRVVLVGVLAAFGTSLAGLYLAKGTLIEVVADRVPTSLETALGDGVLAQLEKGRSFVETPEPLSGLSRMTGPLLAALPEQEYAFRFHIVADPSINAFALPGGSVVIHSGLLLKATSPEEVLGVLAHEMAHVTRRHSLRQLVGTLGLFTVVQALFGDLTGMAAVLTEGGTELLSLRFSRDHEREADDAGWDYLLAAGVDPRGMLSFFTKLREEEERLGPVSSAQGYLALLSTHPATPERIERLVAKLGEVPAGRRFSSVDVDFRAFQEALDRDQAAAATERR